MSLPTSPFTISTSIPGHGIIDLCLLPPNKPSLTTFTYQYPLKLISPRSHISPSNHPISLVFLLTYGGGLVGGDKINLRVTLEAETRLALVTQGSTKIFKSPTREVVSRQTLDVHVGPGAGLCYLPDPTQPFAESVYEQRQVFRVAKGSSLCMLDWVSEGRRARGESWSFRSWIGKNEVREAAADGEDGRLLIRDAIILENEQRRHVGQAYLVKDKVDGRGVVGTLILHGPLFNGLASFFLEEFGRMPRIGGKTWTSQAEISPPSRSEEKRARRLAQEKTDGVLWTAASVRGFVLVKFGATEVEGARRWLGHMIRNEGSIEREFGSQALLCLR